MKQDICSALEEQFVGFASENILNNLPFVSDGLLAVQRKSIWGMIQKGRTHDKQFIKMLKAQGEIMTYYVFGDMPLSGALKNMGNNSLNYMYLTPRGSFGDKRKKDDNGAAARYIECKLSKYAEDMCVGIKKNNVPMKRNYDNTENEPIVLPSMIPNVLLNTSQSISVGESSKIPAHNLIEVCDSFISYLKTKNIDQSISMLNGADLSLGGQILYDKGEFEKIYRTGKGSFTLLGKHTYDKDKNVVTITEVPYETYIETIEEKLRLQYEKGNFKEIADIHDGSDKDGIKLNIYLKKGTNVDQFIAKLRKFTPYESRMSCNFTLIDIDNKTPLLMSLENIIVKWTTHRKQCLRKELEYDINALSTERNKLKGLEIIVDSLDEAIAIIRGSKSESEAMNKLVNRFSLNEDQALYISSIKLINMHSDWIGNKLLRLKSLEDNIKTMYSDLDSEDYYINRIISDLEYCKKTYGQPRKTTIVYEHEVKPILNDILIENYNCQIVLTEQGYLKKTLRYSDTQKVKDGDTVIQQVPSTNKSKLLFFTDKANCYYLNAYDVETTQPSNLGNYLPTMLQLQDEKILYAISTEDFKGYVLFAFENGKVAKINLSSYETKTNRTKIINAYNTDSKLISINFIEKDCDFMAISSIDKVLVVNTELINPKDTKSSQGVNVLRSKKDSYMIEFKPCTMEEEVKEYYRVSNTPATGKYSKKDF